jgi:hypothetical protein
MSTPVPTEEFDAADEESEGPNRRRATLAILPFLGLGLFSVVVLLGWGIDPLWAFAILPPILFISVLGWIAFKTGFVDGPD